MGKIIAKKTKLWEERGKGGPYFLLNASEHPILREDYDYLRRNGWLYYESSDMIEDYGPYNLPSGYRLGQEGVKYLEARGYDLEIDTPQKRKMRKQKEAQKLQQQIQINIKKEKREKAEIEKYATQHYGGKWKLSGGKVYGGEITRKDSMLIIKNGVIEKFDMAKEYPVIIRRGNLTLVKIE